MTGVAGSAAPAASASGAPAEGNATSATAAPQSTAPAPAWGEKDDAELFERLQRSPYGKVKSAKGEFALKSKADFEALHRSHQRVSGVNTALEEAKRERAAAAKDREDIERQRGLFQRAKDGDEAAWSELGLVSPEARRSFEEDLQQLTPEQRQLVEENRELHRREAERQRQEADAKMKGEREKLRTAARSIAEGVTKALGMDAPDSATLMAVAEVMDLNTKAGLDATPEEIREFVLEKMRDDSTAAVAKLPHAVALEKLGDYLRGAPAPVVVKTLAPLLAGMSPADVFEAMGDAALPFVRGLSALYVEKRRGAQVQPPVQQQAPQQEERQQPQGGRVFGLMRPR